MLFSLPALPNCPAIFWPLASASLRLSCAQIAANKQTTRDLLEAIELVHELPPDHPLRPEVDRLIVQWSEDILRLAEADFQAGKLGDAISAVRKIPTNTPASSQVEAQIQNWRKIWAEAEKIYEASLKEMRQENYGKAFMQAVRLLSVGNTYWETTKYQELTNLIGVARKEGSKLVQARRLAEQGTLKSILEAIRLAETIPSKSQLHQEARLAIAEFGQKLLDLAQVAVDRKDLQGAISIARKIPASAGLKEQVRDFIALAEAQSLAWGDTVEAIEAAIAEAQKIDPGRPLYGKAQQLIARWQLEVGDVVHLTQAREMAIPGTIDALNAAITEASSISPGNPRRQEAQRLIARWKSQIETIEDRPILDQAEIFARSGDLISLQAAIEEARQIGRNRALHTEAQKKIQTWTQQIQRIQDQPVLDAARDLAESGDLASAIATASQIKSGRTLYADAQRDIQTWRDQIAGQQSLQAAYQLATAGNVDSLVRAIAIAQDIPSSSSARRDAEVAANQWSREILEAARSQATTDLGGAIVTARKVPPRTEAYAEAQLQIAEWRRQGEGLR